MSGPNKKQYGDAHSVYRPCCLRSWEVARLGEGLAPETLRSCLLDTDLSQSP